MNTSEIPLEHDPERSPADPLAEPARPEAPTGVRVVVNGRTVLHRHFLQQAMDAMVRRALAEEELARAS